MEHNSGMIEGVVRFRIAQSPFNLKLINISEKKVSLESNYSTNKKCITWVIGPTVQ